MIRLAVVVLLIFSAAVGALMSPGLRHRHAGGTLPHSHANGLASKTNDASHRHSHSHRHTHHHGHSHAHGHAHHHGHSHAHAAGSHHSHDEAVPQSTPHREHADVEQHRHADSTASHIHVWLLGWELTLPDWSGGDVPVAAMPETPEAEAAPAGEQRMRSSDSDQFVEIRGPSLAGELVRLVLDFRVLPVARYVLPDNRWLSDRRAMLDDPSAGRDRPCPPSPPPEIQA